jgi:hypothetical protein
MGTLILYSEYGTFIFINFIIRNNKNKILYDLCRITIDFKHIINISRSRKKNSRR